MKPCYFVINEKKPDFETDRAKWWLCDRGDKYAIWRVDSHDGKYKAFVIQRISDGAIVAEEFNIESVGAKFELYENLY